MARFFFRTSVARQRHPRARFARRSCSGSLPLADRRCLRVARRLRRRARRHHAARADDVAGVADDGDARAGRGDDDPAVDADDDDAVDGAVRPTAASSSRRLRAQPRLVVAASPASSVPAPPRTGLRTSPCTSRRAGASARARAPAERQRTSLRTAPGVPVGRRAGNAEHRDRRSRSPTRPPGGRLRRVSPCFAATRVKLARNSRETRGVPRCPVVAHRRPPVLPRLPPGHGADALSIVPSRAPRPPPLKRRSG